MGGHSAGELDGVSLPHPKPGLFFSLALTKGEVAAQRHADYARSFGCIGETSRHWPDRDLDFAHFGIDRVLWIRHL